ncbi:MAG: phenylacetic acid degradation protein PaaY, partial [Burkholderiaceae bacterium]|nr:phenylacetic acid degradation protein PaaY [Burkholderiaceae bacterium]
LVAGMPARGVRELREDELRWKAEGTAQYHELARRSLATLREVQPLTAVEPDRRRFSAEDVMPLIARRRAQASQP